MLTADHVRARTRGKELALMSLSKASRAQAAVMANDYIMVAEEHVGEAKSTLEAALQAVEVPDRMGRVSMGLRKLIDERCDFGAPSDVDAVALRKAIFEAAAAHRRELGEDEPFDRDVVIEAVAPMFELAPHEVDEALFSDLKSAQKLTKFETTSADVLLDNYEEGQAQAVLLKAERVVAEVYAKNPKAYRALFRKLKFHRLLFHAEPLASAPGAGRTAQRGYRLEIDGPFSMFQAGSKYGLQLALLYPWIKLCDRWAIEANIRWGKSRRRLVFKQKGKASKTDVVKDTLAPELEKLIETYERKQRPFKVERADELLHVPGAGVCVPDLVFKKGNKKVYLEALGYWSRDAVWKRVELVEKGLGAPVIFVVPERLRVSKAVLGKDLPAQIVLYKGVIRVGAIEAALKAIGR